MAGLISGGGVGRDTLLRSRVAALPAPRPDRHGLAGRCSGPGAAERAGVQLRAGERAAVGMRREDYRQGTRGWLRLHEKGGKRHGRAGAPPGRGRRRGDLAAVSLEDAKTPLFQSVDRASRLSGRPLARRVVLAMIKRRAAAGLPASTCCHASGRDVRPRH